MPITKLESLPREIKILDQILDNPTKVGTLAYLTEGLRTNAKQRFNIAKRLAREQAQAINGGDVEGPYDDIVIESSDKLKLRLYVNPRVPQLEWEEKEN